MLQANNALLFVGDALIYFAVLAGLFRYRRKFGLGAFFCALGVLHFIETYLASTLYVPLPFGIVASPGSAVLFSGKLMMLLLVYIREDAAVVRQPIYGLLFGNLLTLLLAVLLRHHVAPGQTADLGFLDQIGGLMVWGTALLFVDCILIILLYERSRAFLGEQVTLRLWLCAAAVLTFDQVGFFIGLKLMIGADWTVMIGGWVAKMAAAALYAALAGAYLHFLDRVADARLAAPSLGDVFDTLTYRERYQALLERSERDALTGVLARGPLEARGTHLVQKAAVAGHDLALIVIDIDNFKQFNDRFGHAAGDMALRRTADRIATSVRSTDHVFRFGGEEFVVICDGLGGATAVALAEHLRRTIAETDTGVAARVTASLGVATCPADAHDYGALFAIADRRMYAAKAAGRNRVAGSAPEGAPQDLPSHGAPSLDPAAPEQTSGVLPPYVVAPAL